MSNLDDPWVTLQRMKGYPYYKQHSLNVAIKWSIDVGSLDDRCLLVLADAFRYLDGEGVTSKDIRIEIAMLLGTDQCFGCLDDAFSQLVHDDPLEPMVGWTGKEFCEK